MTEASAGGTSDVVEEREDECEDFRIEKLRTIVVEPFRLLNVGFKIAVVEARDVDVGIGALVDDVTVDTEFDCCASSEAL